MSTEMAALLRRVRDAEHALDQALADWRRRPEQAKGYREQIGHLRKTAAEPYEVVAGAVSR